MMAGPAGMTDRAGASDAAVVWPGVRFRAMGMLGTGWLQGRRFQAGLPAAGACIHGVSARPASARPAGQCWGTANRQLPPVLGCRGGWFASAAVLPSHVARARRGGLTALLPAVAAVVASACTSVAE